MSMEACKWADSIYKINQMLLMVVGTDFSRLTQKSSFTIDCVFG